MNNFSIKFVLLAIFLLGLFFRLQGNSWDQNQHLNPDERFLTMVLGGMKLPDSLSQFFSTNTSPLNPINVGFPFFVYGTLPMFINFFVSKLLSNSSYDGFLNTGRMLSGLFDAFTILVVFFIAKELSSYFKPRLASIAGLIAAFFYALSVVPIQNSHFFIVDTFGNFFAAATLYFLLVSMRTPSLKYFSLLSIFLGLALSCKLNFFLLIPGICLGLLFTFIRFRSNWYLLIPKLAVIPILSFLILRICLPYAFSEGSLLVPDTHFLANSKEASRMVKGEVDMPPAVVWAATNFFFPLQEMTLWGLGLPLGLLFWFSLGFILFWSWSRRHTPLLIFITTIAIQFAYQSHLSSKTQRYYLLCYVLASVVVSQLLVIQKHRLIFKLVFPFVALLTLTWAISFSRIYSRPHSRVAASDWIYRALPEGSTVTYEGWDDPLPLLINNKPGGLYPGVETTMYDQETPDKLDKLIRDLTAADYIILSSNRLYGSIPRIPARYPLAIRYYDLLFSNQLGFTKLITFTSFPGLGNFQINDSLAEEIFSVYDHPQVTVFIKDPSFSPLKLKSIFQDVDFSQVEFILAKDVPPTSWFTLKNFSSNFLAPRP